MSKRSKNWTVCELGTVILFNRFWFQSLPWGQESYGTLRETALLALVVQTLGSAIHQINHHPLDKYHCTKNWIYTKTWRTYLRIVSTHVLQYLWPHAIVCTASLRRPSHLGHKCFLSIFDRSAEVNSYPGIVRLKVDEEKNKQLKKQNCLLWLLGNDILGETPRTTSKCWSSLNML